MKLQVEKEDPIVFFVCACTNYSALPEDCFGGCSQL
jgi:hypothetical protein